MTKALAKMWILDAQSSPKEIKSQIAALCRCMETGNDTVIKTSLQELEQEFKDVEVEHWESGKWSPALLNAELIAAYIREQEPSIQDDETIYLYYYW